MFSITVGADHLAAIARAERLVSRHIDRIFDELDAAVGEGKIAPAGVVAAGIDETRPFGRPTGAGRTQAATAPTDIVSNWEGQSY